MDATLRRRASINDMKRARGEFRRGQDCSRHNVFHDDEFV